MTTKYYLKEIASNSLLMPDGKPLAFTSVVNNTGLIETTDKELIQWLESVKGRFGVYEVSAEEFKKKLNATPLKTREPKSNAPRIADFNNNPFAQKPNLPEGTVITQQAKLDAAKLATEQENARHAVGSSHAAPAKVEGTSTSEKPKLTPRKGVAKPKHK